MKSIVLYKSKYGNTLQYAKWIGEALNCEVRDLKDFKRKEISQYEEIIFGSGVYMGKLNKIDQVLKMFKTKPITIFACAGHLFDQNEISKLKERHFTQEQLSFHQFFYLPGGVDFTKLTGMTKKMVLFFLKMIEKKENKTQEEIDILEGYYHPTCYVDKKYITDIVSSVQNKKQS